ncbi:MAG: signal peptidase I [Clostridia bacterium]|nr:signal peptidase I [Clostridia bacterium]
MKTKKVAKIIGYSAVGLTVAFIVYVLICFFTGSMLNIFGNGITTVVTGSMEPTIKTGSIVSVDFIDADEVYSLKTGETDGAIVVYKGEVGGKDAYIMHRLIEIKDNGTVITKGDANNGPDAPVDIENIIGVYNRTLPFLSSLSAILLTPWGFIILAFIPCLIVIIMHLVNAIKLGVKLKMEKEEEMRLENLKKQALEEFLKENNKEDETKTDG